MDCVVLNGGRADRFGLGSEMDGDAAAREDACREYQSSLEDLTFNSKPHINMLTILAEENLHFAKDIVAIIEAQITKAPPSEKLPVLYLVDSIVKNVGGEYLAVFAKNLVTSFICVFEKVDENIRKSLYKLRSTWDDVFPLKKLYALDVRVNSVDSAWPIKPLPLTVNASIHVNPKFLKQSDEAPPRPRSTVPPPAATPPLAPSASEGQLIRQQLLAKQKQLLELQQKKIELELEQTKAQLAGGFVLTPTVPQASGPVVPATAPKSASQTAPAIRPWVPPQPETKPSARDPRLHRPGPPATPQSKDQPSANKDGQSLGGTAQNAEKRLLEKSGRVDKPRPQKKAAREEKPKSPPPMPKGAPSRGKHSEADSSKKDPRLQKRTHDKSGDTREEEKKKRSTEIKKEREETPRALHPLRPAKAKPVNGSLSKHDQAQSAEKADFQSGGNARTNARKRTHSRSRSPTTAISCSPKRKDRRSPKGRARSNSSSPSPSHLQGKVRRAYTDEPLRGKAGREDRAPPKKSLTEPKRAKRPLGERDTHSPRGHSEARETKEVPHRWRSGWEDNKHLKKSEDAHGNPGPQRQKPYVSSRPTTPRMLKHRLSVDTNLQIPDVLNSASKRDLLMRASKRLESGEISQDDFLNVAHQIQQLFKYQEEKQQQRSDSWEASDNDAPPPKKVLPTHSTMDDAELSYYEHKSKLRRTRVNHPPGGSGEEWEAERRQEEEPPPNPEASPGSSRSSPHKYTEPPRERPADRRSKEREEPLPHTPMIEEYNHGKEFPTLKSLHGLRFRRRADPRDSSEREWNSPLTERQRYDREKHKSGYDAPRRYAGHPDPRNTDPHRPERLPLPATVVHRKCPSPTNVEAPPAGYERERLSPLHQAEAAELSPLPMFESPNSEHSDDGPLGTDAPLVHPIHPPRPPILKALSHAAGTLALVRQHSDSPEHTPPQDGGAPSTRYEGPSHNGPPRPPPPGRYEAGRPGRYGDPSCYNGPHHQVRQGIPERPDGPAQYDGPPVPHGPMGGSMGRGMGRFDGPPLPQGQNRYEAPICQQPPVRFDGPGPGPMQRFDGPVRFENNAGGGPGPMGFQPRPMHFDSASNQMGPMRFEGPGAMRFNGPGPMFGPLHNMQAPMRPVAPYDNPTPAQQNFNMVNQCFPEAINPPQYSAGPLPFPVQQNLSQTGGGDFSMQPGPPFTQPAAPPFYNPALPTAGNIQQPVNMMPNLNQTFLSQNPVPFRQPGAPFSAPESHFGQVDVNDLLTKLISTGIIPASTTSKQESSEPSGTEPSSAPQAVQGPEEEEQEDDDDIPDLTGFVIVDMKLRYGSVVTKLYTGIQCYSCGMRFTASQTDVYADHLDWHYRQNRSEKDISRKITHRRWYYTLKDWIEFEEIADLEERAKSHFFEKVNEEEVQRSQEAAKQDEFQSVKATADVVGESCEICQEAFEMYWEEEEEEWHLKNALRVEGKTYHPSCYEDYKNTSSFLDATPSPSVTPAEHPLSAFVKKEVDEEEAASCLASVKQEAEPEAGEVARIKKEDEGSTEDPQSA